MHMAHTFAFFSVHLGCIFCVALFLTGGSSSKQMLVSHFMKIVSNI